MEEEGQIGAVPCTLAVVYREIKIKQVRIGRCLRESSLLLDESLGGTAEEIVKNRSIDQYAARNSSAIFPA